MVAREWLKRLETPWSARLRFAAPYVVSTHVSSRLVGGMEVYVIELPVERGGAVIST